MHVSVEDQLFERFCRTGDTAALAEVFDRTAPELLRVAAHVAGDPQAAEDLVQATFLAALESAREWDPERRLVPWLIGILTHRAQTLRRQERREPDRERVRREATVDPSDEVQRAETWRELDRAIDTVPAVYQTPLVLHLRHGLSANEIAAAMRRPAGTVRAQLSRGTEHLRKALPVGISLALAPIRGLAAVRAVVLARAEGVAAGVGWSSATVVLGGVLLMKKTLAVLCLVLVAVSVYLAWPAALAPSGAAAEVTSPGAATAQGPAASRAATAPQAPRTALRLPVAVPATAASLLVRARFADGAVAEGAVVTVQPANPRIFDPRERAATVTAEGAARFAAVAPGKWFVHGDRGGRIPVEVGAEGETACDLEIPRGVAVRGHVRDADQRPIAGARVWLSRSWLDGSVVARTGPDGAFTLRDVAPDREVSALADGFAPSRCRVVVGKPGETIEAELVLERSDVLLTGTVVDRLGRGIAGARVCVGDQLLSLEGSEMGFPDPNAARVLWSQPPVLEVQTDPAGRFQIAGPPLSTRSLGAAVSADGFALWTGVWQVGEDRGPVEVAVTLLRGGTVRGVVRDAEGRPLAGVLVHAAAEDGPSAGSMDTGADGGFVFEHLPAQKLRFSTRQRGVGAATTSLDLRDEQELRWDPVLGGGPYLIGRVTDERGAPLPGWKVGAWAPPSSEPRALFDTDASGRFRIPECTEPRYTLEAFDPAAPRVPLQPVASVTAAEAGSEEHRLVVEDGKRATGFVTALVVGAGGEPVVGATVFLMRLPRNSMVEETTDEHGRYRSYALAPGTFELSVVAAGYAQRELAAILVAPHATADLGTIQLERAGSVVVTVRGADPGKDPIGLRLVDAAGRGNYEFVQQEDGTWRSGAVPAGRYGVVLWPKNAAVTRVPVEVPRGGVARVEVNVEPGIPCRFTFAGANDPEATWDIDWKAANGDCLEQGVRWQLTGTLTRRFAPGTWSVEIRSEDGRKARKEFTVATTDRELDVQVPPPAR